MMADKLMVKKTYKLYVGGKFPRSESGQVLVFKDRKGKEIASYCKASRKDIRDTVIAAQSGLKSWKAATPYLRGQILYRAAEMLEGRASQFVEELQLQGRTKAAARKDVRAAIDRMVYYAGWTDKTGHVFSSVNPVASPHFCFTVPEPCGVVAILAGGNGSLCGLVESSCSILAGGNAGILVVGGELPLTAATLGEIWHTSDLPSGALNILTGDLPEAAGTLSGHRAVDGIYAIGLDPDLRKSIQESAADSLKRLWFVDRPPDSGSPYSIRHFLEMKTTWHPVGI